MSVNAVTVAEAKRVAKQFVALCETWEREDKQERASVAKVAKENARSAFYMPHWYKPVGTSAALKRRSHDLRVVLAELRRT